MIANGNRRGFRGKSGTMANSRGMRPRVEEMEARLLLSVASEPRSSLATVAVHVDATGEASAANRAYLTSLEDVFMTGPLAPKREAALLRKLDAGVPRARVAADLLKAPEFAASAISSAYQSFLHRAPTAAEARKMATVLQAGGDSRNVFVALASGQEYATVRGGGTTTGFVLALYQDVLRRSAQNGEEQYWVGRLNAGESRTAVIRSIVLSPESISQNAKGITLGTPDAGSASALARVARIIRTPGGLNRLRISLVSTPSFFARATQLDLTTPPATDTGPLIHPPGLPMSPGLDLATRWTPLDTSTGPALDGTNLVAAASDGSIWVTGPTGHRDQLYVQTPADYFGGMRPPVATWRALPKLPYTVQYLSAVSNNLLYAVAETSEQTSSFGGLFRVDGQGNVAQVSTPSGVKSVSAATDGTLMAIAGTTAILQLPGQSDWTTLPEAVLDNRLRLTPAMVSTGSKDSIYALQQISGINFVYRYFAGQWELIENTDLSPLWLSATSDGALWIWDFHRAAVRSPITGQFQVVNSTIVSDANGVVQTTPVNAPEAIGVGAAISQNRLVVSLSPNDQQANTIQVLSLGIADQQAVPILPTDPQLLDFYNEISVYLNADGPGGIRAVYDTSVSGILSNFYSNLLGMPQPADVNMSNLAQWTAFQHEIENELNDAVAVQGLFTSLNLINADIKANNALDLPAIESEVSGSQNIPIPPTSSLTLYLENAIEALLWGLAAALPGPGAIIGSILASAYGSAISQATNDPTPSSNTNLKIQYSALTSTLDSLSASLDAINLAYETSVLTDWSRLASLGALLTGPNAAWHPPVGSEGTVADDTKPAYHLFFYQTLMPAKWQLVSIPTYTPTWDSIDFICTPSGSPYPPTYDLVTTFIGHVPGATCEIDGYQFLNQLGSNPDPFSTSDGPYPLQPLLQHIFDLGVSKQTLLSGGGGFNFQVVAGPSGP
jgi:Domain of unknown function (DUF4214)